MIRELVGELTIAGGRWLVAALLKNGSKPQNRIMVWDLDSDADDPIGGWFEQVGDIYQVIVTTENADSFQTVQVFRILELPPYENFCEMVRFDWPSGEITRFNQFKNLRIWPVECELGR